MNSWGAQSGRLFGLEHLSLSLSMTKERWPMTNEIELSVARSSPPSPSPPLLLSSSLLSSIYSLSPSRVLPKRVYSLHFYISTGRVERAPQFWDAATSTSTRAFAAFLLSQQYRVSLYCLLFPIVSEWDQSWTFIRCHTFFFFLSFPLHLRTSSDLPVDVEVRIILNYPRPMFVPIIHEHVR